jgi:hypothetical protein
MLLGLGRVLRPERPSSPLGVESKESFPLEGDIYVVRMQIRTGWIMNAWEFADPLR